MGMVAGLRQAWQVLVLLGVFALGVWAKSSGILDDALRYQDDILYLARQHMELVAISGGLAVLPALIEAARGMGMTNRQILFKVELPNALFVILAGLRTAFAINVGTVPLAFLIGGGGLGELIFTGIDLMEPGLLLAGAIPTALLAVLVDALIGQAQYWLVPRGVNPLR